jgi:nucleotide-binding universal stress UspA family protein
MFTRVLVPLDGSPESAIALPLARAVARSTGAEISLLQVVPSDEQAKQAKAALERIASELASPEIHVTTRVCEGEIVADEILEQVRTQGADLVVMRTHGRAGVMRAVLGSVTQRVVAESQVPVLLLRPGGRRVSHIRSLLVPVDGSPGAAVALSAAAGLARVADASIHLVEVVVPIPNYISGAWAIDGGVYVDPAWDDEALVGARTYVDRVAARLQASGLTADGEARVGASIPDAIVRAAEEAGVDLIVMSTQALTGPARALLGSVADAVVRAADCPVLLLHRAAASRTESEAGGDEPLSATTRT